MVLNQIRSTGLSRIEAGMIDKYKSLSWWQQELIESATAILFILIGMTVMSL